MKSTSTSNHYDPRQEKYINAYIDPNSSTFANAYKSAVHAGYSHETSRNLTHNRPLWLSEKLGQLKIKEPEELLANLSEIADNRSETTANRMKAIELLLKVNGMFKPQWQQNNVQINIQDVLR